jgi:hypothetical protein
MLATTSIRRNVLQSLQNYILMDPCIVKWIIPPFPIFQRRQVRDCVPNGCRTVWELRRLEVRQSRFGFGRKHHAAYPALWHA